MNDKCIDIRPDKEDKQKEKFSKILFISTLKVSLF